MIGCATQQLVDVVELIVGESEGAVDGGILGGGHGRNLAARQQVSVMLDRNPPRLEPTDAPAVASGRQRWTLWGISTLN